jgi:hypothetical protein
MKNLSQISLEFEHDILSNNLEKIFRNLIRK